jgi:hypothetical protein
MEPLWPVRAAVARTATFPAPRQPCQCRKGARKSEAPRGEALTDARRSSRILDFAPIVGAVESRSPQGCRPLRRSSSIAGLLIVAATLAVFVQAMSPAAALASLPAVGSPITLSIITLPERTTTTMPTTTTTKPACKKHKCPPPTTTTTVATTTVPTTIAKTPPTTKPGSRPPSSTVPPSSPLLGRITPIQGVALVQNAPAPTTTTTTTIGPASSSSGKKSTKTGAAVVGGVFNDPMVLARGGWKGLSLQAATNLKVPIVFGVAVALFVLGQALIDRRDPKLSRAPERNVDDTVGFE